MHIIHLLLSLIYIGLLLAVSLFDNLTSGSKDHENIQVVFYNILGINYYYCINKVNYVIKYLKSLKELPEETVNIDTKELIEKTINIDTINVFNSGGINIDNIDNIDNIELIKKENVDDVYQGGLELDK